MSEHFLTLFTYHGKSEIINKGYIGDWRLNKHNAKACTYAVCVQLHGEWGKPEHKPHEAFLIVKIRDVGVCPHDSTRYRIYFDEYAELTLNDKVSGNANPVAYRTAEKLGIDLSSIEFTKITNRIEPVQETQSPPPQNDTLTIPEAKRRLALTLGVSEDNITISINH